VWLSLAPAASALVPAGNLIRNGNAESGTGATDSTTTAPSPIPGWTTSANFTEHFYATTQAPDGFPDSDVSASIGGGNQFFAGGPGMGSLPNTSEAATQDLNVSQAAPEIDALRVTATLSGWLGGYQSQADSSKVKASFLDGAGKALGQVTIGPVTASERGNTTTLKHRSANARVPRMTRTIRVTLTMAKPSEDTTYNDGYADNIGLSLTAAPVARAPSGAARLTARLRVTPNPTCVGTLTRADGSASSGPAPIVRYDFYYTEHFDVAEWEPETGRLYPNPHIGSNYLGGQVWADRERFSGLPVPPSRRIQFGAPAFGAASEPPVVTDHIGWNLTVWWFYYHPGRPGYPHTDWVEDLILGPGRSDGLLLNLTVTDARGATDSTSVPVNFVEHVAGRGHKEQATGYGHKKCPKVDSYLSSVARAKRPVLTRRSVTLDVKCPSAMSCFGTAEILTSRALKRRAAHKSASHRKLSRKKKARARFSKAELALGSFVVPSHKTKRIALRLTKRGRRLLRHRRRAKVRLRLTSFGADGRRHRRTKVVVIKRARHARPRR
jgi:hypothetical protein